MSKKVSVIIPAYNAQECIKECIDSVLKQTYKNYEIIIVNDGSKDDTLKIVKDYEKEYENIQVIDISNHGQGYARNVALSQATGDYILFLDADDLLEKVTLQVCVEKIEQDESDFVVFDWKNYYEETGEISYFNTDPFFGNKILEGSEILELFKTRHYFTVNKLYSKKFLIDNDIKYGEGYIYEDNPFWVKVIVEAKKVSLIHSPLYIVRVSKKSTTKTNYDTDKHYIGFIKAVEEIVKITKKYPNNDYTALYTYLLKKFDLYYRVRIPNKYKREFRKSFVKTMQKAIGCKPIDTNSRFIKLCFKYKIFEDDREILFYFIYKLFVAQKNAKKIYKKIKNVIKDILTKIKAIKEGNLLVYKNKLKPIDEDSIVFMGFDYRYTGNSRYLFEELLKKKEENIFFVTDNKQVEDKHRIKPNSKQMYNKIYNSKIVIFESWIPKNIKKREDSIWIQLWHGTPLKKMLFDSEEKEIITVNKKHKIQKYQDITNWNYILTDNPNIYQYFETSFLIPEEKVLNSGYPRVKYLLDNINNSKLKDEIKDKIKIPKDKKIVSYLPTWRDYNYDKDKSNMDFDYFMNMEELQNILGEEYVIVSKNHVFLNNENSNKITNVNIETQELLLISDYLVTDYSSVMFDAFAVNIPVVILANDYEKYSKSRGVYEKIWNDLLPFVTYSEKEVAEKLLNYSTDSKEYKNLKDKYGYKSELDLVEFILKLNEKR